MKFSVLSAAVALALSAQLAHAGLAQVYADESAFTLALTNQKKWIDSLENLGNGDTGTEADPLGMSFDRTGDPSRTGVLFGSAAVTTAANGTGGRQPHDGDKFWEGADAPFTVQFDAATKAFGFWASDIGDFLNDCDPQNPLGCSPPTQSAVLKITLFFDQLINIDGSDVTQKDYFIDGGRTNGNELFWGFTSSTPAAVTKVVFTNLTGGRDGQGFDSFMVGDVVEVIDPNPTPEPGMLALAGLALTGLAAARRRRR